MTKLTSSYNISTPRLCHLSWRHGQHRSGAASPRGEASTRLDREDRDEMGGDLVDLLRRCSSDHCGRATGADVVAIGLVGRGIGSSRSPVMHEREARRLGIAMLLPLLDFDRLDFRTRRSGDVVARCGAGRVSPASTSPIPSSKRSSPSRRSVARGRGHRRGQHGRLRRQARRPQHRQLGLRRKLSRRDGGCCARPRGRSSAPAGQAPRWPMPAGAGRADARYRRHRRGAGQRLGGAAGERASRRGSRPRPMRRQR